MTKLAEWLVGLSILGMAWITLTFDLLGLDLPGPYQQVIWPFPVYLLVVFGCYSLATIGYRVATFNDCEDAAKELQDQIKEAKKDLVSRGLKF
ncbi:dolichol-phosphate mannosyltransferase subunit 3 [Ascaphus truei]|uniref:dolichol-phosphate mannosyltransferase subunit 3 n=1 Tax=Ascaphus truei TaxID=8439 RepID=UPI003F593E44